jgi:glycosyltransferase involved in cell wall biosynthesis
MKIALCKSHFAGPISGADETLVAYALGLHDVGCDVQVVLLYRCADDDQYYLRLKHAGVPVSFVIGRSQMFEVLQRCRNSLASCLFFLFLMPQAPQTLRRIWQILMQAMTRFHYRSCRTFFRSMRPDVLHVVTPDSGAALLISVGHEFGIPVFYQELGTPQHLPALDPCYRDMEKVLPLCVEFGALSPRLAAEWSARFPFLRSVSVLPLIIERCNTFNLASRFPLGPEEIVFGFAARLEEGKGPLILLDALARINRKGPLAVARIAGMGPQLLEVKARVRELAIRDACEFVGHYSEPLGRTAFLNSLDVFVLPSLAEGTPNCIIEAMAHGIPVIASDVGGIPDIIGDDAGIRVAPGDSYGLANAMSRLANDPELRKRMGAAAQERYQKLFSPKVVLPLLLDTYQRVAGNGHAAKTGVAGNGNLHPWAEGLGGKKSNEAQLIEP